MSELDSRIRDLVEEGIVRSAYGRLLGIEVIACQEGRAVLRMPFQDELTTLGTTVHGGAIASLIDTAATAAFWASSSIPPTARGTTIGFTVNFVSAARGTDLTAEAIVRRRGRQISVGEVVVRDDEGQEIALSLVTYKLSHGAG